MDDRTVKAYQSQISAAWKVMKPLIGKQIPDADWTDIVNSTADMCRKFDNSRFIRRLCYEVIDELNKGAKSEVVLYFNAFLDCGNLFRESDTWDLMDGFVQKIVPKYNSNRFATQMIDACQVEIADYLTQKEGDAE